MQQFRVHYAAFQGSLCGKLCDIFQFILSYCTWSKEKKSFLHTYGDIYTVVNRLRTNLIFKQIALHIPRMGFALHMFVNDALPQMVDYHVACFSCSEEIPADSLQKTYPFE